MTNIEIIRRIRITFELLLNLKAFGSSLNCVMNFSKYLFSQSVDSVSAYFSVLVRPCKSLLIMFFSFGRHLRSYLTLTPLYLIILLSYP